MQQSFRQVLKSRGRGLSEAEVKALLDQALQQLLPLHQQGQAYGNISLDTLMQDAQTGQVSLAGSNNRSLAQPKDDIDQLVTTLIELLTNQPSEQLLQPDGRWNWQDECLVSDQFAALIERVISPGETQFANAMDMLGAMNSSRRSQPATTTLSFAPAAPEATVMLKERPPQVERFSSAATEKSTWFWFAIGSGAIALLVIGVTLQQKAQVSPSVASSSPADIPSPAPTPSPEPLPVETNPFDQMRFPQNACGDSLPTDLSAYPVNFYPVFVSFSNSNLTIAKSRFCKDALPVVRKDTKIKAIQIASFTSVERANFFREYVSREISNAEVGASTVIQKTFSGE
jgi:hypothetical protein